MPKPQVRWKTIFFCFCLALLLFTVAANIYILRQYFVGVFLEHDSAAEILLAKQIAVDGRLVYSDNWYYSTELRTLHNQLVMAPLFYLFNDMLLVHLISSAIINVLMASAAVAALKLLKVATGPALLGGALAVTAFSYETYYINVAGSYYSFFIISTLLFVALLFRLFHACTKKSILVTACACAAISFIQGLSGFRYLIILYAPLGALMLLLAMRRFDTLVWPTRTEKKKIPRDSFWTVFAAFLACCAVYLCGMVVYLKILKPHFGVHSPADSYALSFRADIAQKLSLLPAALLEIFAPLYNMNLGSWVGISEFAGLLAVLGLFACCVYLLLIHKRLPHLQRYWVAFAWLAFAINAFVLVFTDDIYIGGATITARFLMVGMFPMVTLPPIALGQAVGGKARLLPPSWRVAAVLALTISLVSNPLSLAGYCRIAVDDPVRGNALAQCTQYLLDNGYKNGFGIYNAQTMEVLSNGELHVTALYYSEEAFHIHKWLRSHQSAEIQYDDQRQFLVVDISSPLTDEFETLYEYGSYAVLAVSPQQIM